MKFLKNFFSKSKKNPRASIDFYQSSIEKIGRDQIKKIVEKGLSFHVVLM